MLLEVAGTDGPASVQELLVEDYPLVLDMAESVPTAMEGNGSIMTMECLMWR